MPVITNAIDNDLGSFELHKDYIVIGSGMQRQETKTSINVLNTVQEKYRELEPTEVLTLAEKLIKVDLDPLFNGPFNTVVTSFHSLPEKEYNAVYYVFISACAFTLDSKIMYSKILCTKPNTTWQQDLDSLTQFVYEELLADMSTQNTDMDYFGVDFISFDIV